MICRPKAASNLGDTWPVCCPLSVETLTPCSSLVRHPTWAEDLLVCGEVGEKSRSQPQRIALHNCVERDAVNGILGCFSPLPPPEGLRAMTVNLV